ncbi:hypothetical protein VDIAB_130002 [Vibrio diabolicus]|nr:hypothetical protein VDIAB_130002 [Vibrio diabolicus]
MNERETFDFAGLKFQEHLNVFIAAASVYYLAPLHLPRRPTRPVSYYAFFK